MSSARSNLQGNPVRHVEIRQSDVHTFADLAVLPEITLTSLECLDAEAQLQQIRQHSVCVISDARFDEKLAAVQAQSSSSDSKSETVSTTTSFSTSSTSSDSKSSSSNVSIIVIGCVAGVVALLAFLICWRRHRQKRKERERADHDHRCSVTAHSEYVDALTPGTIAMMCNSFEERASLGGKPFAAVPQLSCVTSLELYKQLALKVSSDSIDSLPDSPKFSDTMGSSPLLENYRIAAEEVRDEELLQEGAFTNVYKATMELKEGDGCTAVVVRRLASHLMSDVNSINAFMSSIALSVGLNHPNIVEFVGFFRVHDATEDAPSPPVAVTEYMPRGDLRSVLNIASSKSDELHWFLPSTIPRSKAQIALDIVDALVYLHSRSPSLHPRDLRAQKVLLSDNCTAKLCGLGFSRSPGRIEKTIESIGWMAPEILRGEAPNDLSDMYAFGVLLTELDTCALPFAGAVDCETSSHSEQNHLAMLVSSGCIRPALSMCCPEAIQELAMRCLSFDANDRPHAVEVQYTLRKLVDRNGSEPPASPQDRLTVSLG